MVTGPGGGRTQGRLPVHPPCHWMGLSSMVSGSLDDRAGLSQITGLGMGQIGDDGTAVFAIFHEGDSSLELG